MQLRRAAIAVPDRTDDPARSGPDGETERGLPGLARTAVPVAHAGRPGSRARLPDALQLLDEPAGYDLITPPVFRGLANYARRPAQRAVLERAQGQPDASPSARSSSSSCSASAWRC